MKSNNIDVCITFDTTGSMYPCLTQVRRSVEQTVGRLFRDIPDLRIAIIAHGDYIDERSYYVTKIFDFSKHIRSMASRSIIQSRCHLPKRDTLCSAVMQVRPLVLFRAAVMTVTTRYSWCSGFK